MFLPAKLHDRLNEVTTHVDGYPVPLVKHDVMLYKSNRPPEPLAPPRWLGWFFAIGVAVGIVFIGFWYLALREWSWIGLLLAVGLARRRRGRPRLLFRGAGGGGNRIDSRHSMVCQEWTAGDRVWRGWRTRIPGIS